MRPEPYAFLGIRVGAYTRDDLNAAIADAVAAGRRIVIANHNMNSVSIVRSDERMRAFYDAADVVHIDGMPLVPLGRLLGLPLRREHRVTYVDWMPALFAEAARAGWRIFHLGGRPGVAARAAEILRERHPTLAIAVRDGWFDLTEGSAGSLAALDEIARFAPHVLTVGLGMPRQEHWVHAHRASITANATLLAGGAMDYVAGTVPTPPRWAGGASLEWAFRLAAEPRRLGRRYLLEPWPVIGSFVRELAVHKLRRDL
jgi:N-acetylglucosaminyldiphosphoundecaprenol N-acetyl-beta-D-mannosaminyltransferase